jgi:hypothetical protein
MRLLVKVMPLLMGIALIAFAFSASHDGSLPDRIVDGASKAFVDRVADSASADDERRKSLAEKDVAEVARAVMANARDRQFPRKIGGLGYAVATGRDLSSGNHLDAYRRTRHGFRVCVINVSGAWAAWETTRKSAGVVASDTLGGACRYK